MISNSIYRQRKSGEEYKYDKSGNLIQDLNKGIGQIKYGRKTSDNRF